METSCGEGLETFDALWGSRFYFDGLATAWIRRHTLCYYEDRHRSPPTTGRNQSWTAPSTVPLQVAHLEMVELARAHHWPPALSIPTGVSALLLSWKRSKKTVVLGFSIGEVLARRVRT